MSEGIQTFRTNLANFAEKLDIDLGIVIKKLSVDVMGDIVKRTPVDTGRARAGWAMTEGAPSSFVPPESAKDAKPGGGSGEPSDPQFADPPKPIIVSGKQKVYIVNNVHYVQYLEDGHSKQAPFGMVRLAIAVADFHLENELSQLA